MRAFSWIEWFINVKGTTKHSLPVYLSNFYMIFQMLNISKNKMICIQIWYVRGFYYVVNYKTRDREPIFNLFHVNETQDSLSSYYKTYYTDIQYVFFCTLLWKKPMVLQTMFILCSYLDWHMLTLST